MVFASRLVWGAKLGLFMVRAAAFLDGQKRCPQSKVCICCKMFFQNRMKLTHILGGWIPYVFDRGYRTVCFTSLLWETDGFLDIPPVKVDV